MALQLVSPTRGDRSSLPSSDSFRRCMEFRTPEAAKYFSEQAEKCMARAGLLNKSQDLLSQIQKYAESVHLQSENNTSPWTGEINLPTSFQSLHQNLAANAASEIDKKEIIFHFAMSDESQIIRGYSSDNEPATEKTVNAMDTLFNAWLAKNGLFSQEGFIYMSDSNGEILKDENGKPVKVEPEQFEKMLEDRKNGFEQYVHQNNDSVQVKTEQHPFSSPVKEEIAKEEEVVRPQ